MDTQNNERGSPKKATSSSNMTSDSHSCAFREDDEKSSSPAVLFFWIWNWFATLPKTMSNLFADLKSGELLAKFSLLDAMFQFIFAVATSCHPQEEHEVENEEKAKESRSSDEFKAFEGSGRTLRSRTIPTSS